MLSIELEVIDNVIQPVYTDLKNGKYEAKVNNIDLRTLSQNSSQWLWFRQIANLFNRLNLDITMVLKMDTKWNDKKVKAMIFDEVMNNLYEKKSTTKLNKNEYEAIIVTMTQAFGSRGVLLPEFPSIKGKEEK